MRYFSYIPSITYSFETGEYAVVDIFKRVAFKKGFYTNPYYSYEEDQELVRTPDRLSDNKYKTFDNYWLFLLLNNICDVNTDWPQSTESFGKSIDELKKKKVYYVYETAEIAPDDILYLSDTQYGVIESWNPFNKELVMKSVFNLPTNNLSSYEFKIKRVTYSNGSTTITNLTNYCETDNSVFHLFGVKNYTETAYYIKDSSGRNLNPFTKVTAGEIDLSADLLIDVCGSTNRTNFQNSLIYKVVNNQTVNGISVYTQEQRLLNEYVEKRKIRIMNSNTADAFNNKIRIMMSNPAETSYNMFRVN